MRNLMISWFIFSFRIISYFFWYKSAINNNSLKSIIVSNKKVNNGMIIYHC